MSFKNLTNVHSRRNTERIEHDINWLALFIVGHVFNRLDHRDNTLVTVTASHLVTRLDTTLNGEVDLHCLEYTRRKVITALQLATLLFETLVEVGATISQLSLSSGNLVVEFGSFHTDAKPVFGAVFSNRFGSQNTTFLETSCFNHFTANQRTKQTSERGIFYNAVLVIQILAVLIQLCTLDIQRALIFFQTVTSKHLNINNCSFDAGGHTQRSVFYVRRLLAEDCTQKLFFRSKLGLALRRYLANQNIARRNFCTDMNNA